MSSGRYLHDLQVKDGIAYLAYWRDGLIILDVGNGMAGGNPENPKLISQYHFNHYELYGDGWLAGTHSVFRYKNYLFVGDEVFPAIFNIEDRDRIPVRAICHVMDLSDIKHPREVAQYEHLRGAHTTSGQRTTCCMRATTVAVRASSTSPANCAETSIARGERSPASGPVTRKDSVPTCPSHGEVSRAQSLATLRN